MNEDLLDDGLQLRLELLERAVWGEVLDEVAEDGVDLDVLRARACARSRTQSRTGERVV